ncbi:hypothetical protein P691DRAFT_676598 [Macrolepiota fuliginosa MF-IS2]|uniref:Uncharacterized protein n=1 Tax=Macrolepiota fuliginosa MF-IS2 TaxID=1400762 RepID=A0A9P5X5M7_9AGAR|nr:hypothetical protein P691DRAFT_676598 [Macrolepiota fuliginosa MF-IS2]
MVALYSTVLALDPGVIAKGFANNGQDVPAAGQVASLTSTNNFINFCLTVPNLPITNGQQIQGGSCNPAPIGTIPSTDNMPSSKFSFPTNFGAVKTGTAFTIKMQIQNMQTGFFVNANENYFAAPQQLNAQGQIQGHSHVVIEALSAIDQTTLTDPKKFVFFKGLNAAAANGQLTADVTNGLPVGAYKLSSINSAANHQPVIAPVAQHGSLDDAVYFFVTADGNPPANAPFSNNGAAASSAAATSSTVVAASASASASASLTNSVAASASATASVKGSAAASATGKGAAATAKGGAATVKGGAASSAVASASATGKGAGAAAPPKATATGKDTPAGAGSTKATATEKSAAAASTASPAAGTKGTTAGEAGTSKSDPSASNSGKN